MGKGPEAVTELGMALLVLILALAHATGHTGPVGVVGVRTPATVSSPQAWTASQRSAAVGEFIVAVVLAIGGAAGHYLTGGSGHGPARWIEHGCLVLGVALLIWTSMKANRVARSVQQRLDADHAHPRHPAAH